MHTRKWVTNSEAKSDLIPKDDKAVIFDLLTENVSAVKTLVIWWRAECHTFEFKSSLSVVHKITKRIWLSNISTLFDPLGFITSSLLELVFWFSKYGSKVTHRTRLLIMKLSVRV